MPNHVGQCCVCDNEATWQVTRRGDVATSWACGDHLASVCDDLQRDFEVTELVVKLYQKSVEWSQLNYRLNKIAGVPDSRHPQL